MQFDNIKNNIQNNIDSTINMVYFMRTVFLTRIKTIIYIINNVIYYFINIVRKYNIKRLPLVSKYINVHKFYKLWHSFLHKFIHYITFLINISKSSSDFIQITIYSINTLITFIKTGRRGCRGIRGPTTQ
jgi:hypothetical protein